MFPDLVIRWGPTSSEVNVTMYLTDPWVCNGTWPWGPKGPKAAGETSWFPWRLPRKNMLPGRRNWALKWVKPLEGPANLSRDLTVSESFWNINGSSIWWSFDQKISHFPLSNSSNCHKLWVSLVSPGFLRNPIWTTSIRNVQVSHWTCEKITHWQIRSGAYLPKKYWLIQISWFVFYSNQIYNHILIYPHYLYHISAIS